MASSLVIDISQVMHTLAAKPPLSFNPIDVPGLCNISHCTLQAIWATQHLLWGMQAAWIVQLKNIFAIVRRNYCAYLYRNLSYVWEHVVLHECVFWNVYFIAVFVLILQSCSPKLISLWRQLSIFYLIFEFGLNYICKC